MIENRPRMPKRAVVTAGMPYGNKDLHYGHVLGMAFYADIMARFLKMPVSHVYKIKAKVKQKLNDYISEVNNQM